MTGRRKRAAITSLQLRFSGTKRMARLSFWLFGGLTALGLFAASAQAQTPVVQVAQGEVRGTVDRGARAWLGLPFAAPPVGGLRWKPPVTAPAWSGVRPADHFAASCQQVAAPQGLGPWSHEYATSDPVSEDCLYLNIWAPAPNGRKAVKKRPVLVWIYGGGFGSGSGAVPIYNGAALAKKGIVVVNMNYRVGVYGFFAHADLDKENAQGASGNYGLMDQIAALKWVRANIAAFGGDPENVTIAGQSAGAASVHFLIDSPQAKGLFVRAIAESGSGMGLVVADHATADAAGAKFAAAGGVTTLAQLRGLTPDQLLAAAKAAGGMNFGPSVDGLVFADAATADDGNSSDVPVLTGMTANEGSSAYAFGTPLTMTPDGLRQSIDHRYGAYAPTIAALYPAGDDAAATLARETLARDRGVASMYLWAMHRETKSHTPIYAYLWTHVEPGLDAAKYKAFHSSEVPYVFGTLDTPDRPFTALDHKLSDQVQAYWLNFVRKGDPNGPGLPHWPQLTTSDRLILNIGDDTHVQPILDPARLEALTHYIRGGGAPGLFGLD